MPVTVLNKATYTEETAPLGAVFLCLKLFKLSKGHESQLSRYTYPNTKAAIRNKLSLLSFNTYSLDGLTTGRYAIQTQCRGIFTFGTGQYWYANF